MSNERGPDGSIQDDATMEEIFGDELPSGWRDALDAAAKIIIDECLLDLNAVPIPTSNTPSQFNLDDLKGFGKVLPRRYAHLYDRGTLNSFFVTIVTAAHKLSQPWPEEPSCVAEQIAAHSIIEEAERLLEVFWSQEHGSLARFYDEVLYHPDFLLLLDDEPLDASDAHIGFDRWFEPFDKTGPIHPYFADVDLPPSSSGTNVTPLGRPSRSSES